MKRFLILFAALVVAVPVLLAMGITVPEIIAVAIPALMLGAVTDDQLLTKSPNDRSANGVIAAKVLYGGTLAFVDATTGYLTDVATSNKFAGIVPIRYDNASGANGAIQADLWIRGQYVLKGAGFTQADVGKPCNATDNYTVTTAAGTLIGTIRKVHDANTVTVDLNANQTT